MKNKAELLTSELEQAGKPEILKDGDYIAYDNQLLHDILNDECVYTFDRNGVEYWNMCDGSVVARRGNTYTTFQA